MSYATVYITAGQAAYYGDLTLGNIFFWGVYAHTEQKFNTGGRACGAGVSLYRTLRQLDGYCLGIWGGIVCRVGAGGAGD